MVCNILAGGILKHFKGVAVRECWGPCNHEEFNDTTNMVCGCHTEPTMGRQHEEIA
jgi:hypothetical protein